MFILKTKNEKSSVENVLNQGTGKNRKGIVGGGEPREPSRQNGLLMSDGLPA